MSLMYAASLSRRSSFAPGRSSVQASHVKSLYSNWSEAFSQCMLQPIRIIQREEDNGISYSRNARIVSCHLSIFVDTQPHLKKILKQHLIRNYPMTLILIAFAAFHSSKCGWHKSNENLRKSKCNSSIWNVIKIPPIWASRSIRFVVNLIFHFSFSSQWHLL